MISVDDVGRSNVVQFAVMIADPLGVGEACHTMLALRKKSICVSAFVCACVCVRV